jgi:hypothetical protein
MAYKTKYKPINKNKYKGNLDNIICRSLWERFVCKYLDNNDDIIKWSSEEIIIQYYDPVQRKNRRYFPDFFFEKLDGSKFLIEVKPYNQTQKPKSKNKRRLMNETKTYYNNLAKWTFAENWCKEKNIQFCVWTEKFLKKLGMKM